MLDWHFFMPAARSRDGHTTDSCGVRLSRLSSRARKDSAVCGVGSASSLQLASVTEVGDVSNPTMRIGVLGEALVRTGVG